MKVGSFDIHFVRYQPKGIGISISSDGKFLGRVFVKSEELGKLLRMDRKDKVTISEGPYTFNFEVNDGYLSIIDASRVSRFGIHMTAENTIVFFEALRQCCLFYFFDYEDGPDA